MANCELVIHAIYCHCSTGELVARIAKYLDAARAIFHEGGAPTQLAAYVVDAMSEDIGLFTSDDPRFRARFAPIDEAD